MIHLSTLAWPCPFTVKTLSDCLVICILPANEVALAKPSWIFQPMLSQNKEPWVNCAKQVQQVSLWESYGSLQMHWRSSRSQLEHFFLSGHCELIWGHEGGIKEYNSGLLLWIRNNAAPSISGENTKNKHICMIKWPIQSQWALERKTQACVLACLTVDGSCIYIFGASACACVWQCRNIYVVCVCVCFQG